MSSDHTNQPPQASDAPPADWSKLTALRSLKYLGTHPNVTGQVPKIDVIFARAGIQFRSKRTVLGSIEWSSITALEADTREGLERRVTGPRVALLGALAWIAKKETILSYLVIEDRSGTWMFEVPHLSQIELQSGLTPLQRYVPKQEPEWRADVQPEGDVSQRLNSLTQLLEAGHISQSEFETQRKRILDSI